MIENLQESSKQVVEVMGRSQEQTRACVEQTREMDSALQSIADRMERLKRWPIKLPMRRKSKS